MERKPQQLIQRSGTPAEGRFARRLVPFVKAQFQKYIEEKMKKYSPIVLAVFLFGCATSYKPISKLDSVGDATSKNDDFEMVVGIQQMGDNSRFIDKLEENKISILKLTLKNISTNSITIKSENIYLRSIPSNAPVSQLSSTEVADRMKLAEYGYWLWGFLWLGYYENNNGVENSQWYPVGLVIGAINYFRASNTNGNFEKDITRNAFHSADIAAGETVNGMIYFGKRGADRYNVIVSYSDSLGNNKEISLQYKL